MAIIYPLIVSGGQIRQAQASDTLGVGVSEVDIIALTNANASAIAIGRAVYVSAAGACNLAQANAAGTKNVLGIVKDTSIAAGAIGNIQTDGTITATTTQWDAVTGQSGGLTAGSIYFLSATTPGAITTTAPSTAGQYVKQVGVAISATSIDISPGIDVLL